VTVTAPPRLPRAIRAHPHVDYWIRISAKGTVTVLTGKAELGQGIETALAQIAAEELDVSLDRISVVCADTALTPDEFFTMGSTSLEESGAAVRQAAAEAREALLELASAALGVPGGELRVVDGEVTSAGGERTTYWALTGNRPLERVIVGAARPKSREDYSVVGTPARRLDVWAKVTGERCFIHDLDPPGLVHGRVVRPPSPGARLASLNDASPGSGVIELVRDGSFLGVVAEREEQAEAAAAALRAAATWHPGPPLPAAERIYDELLRAPAHTRLIDGGKPVDDPVPPIAPSPPGATTLSATYRRPFQMHASLGPSAAMAEQSADRLTVWTHSQGVFALRDALAQALRVAPKSLRVIHAKGAGCYGHNGADDAAFDAALLARAVPGRPVLLKWSRQDENSWEPYGPATVVTCRGSVAGGDVAEFGLEAWGYPHFARPLPYGAASALLAAGDLRDPLPAPRLGPDPSRHGGMHRNADPLYDFARRRIVEHFVPDSPLRVSALRALGAFANVFAIESFMDELALAASSDPVAFRLRHLTDERAREVIRAAALEAGWTDSPRPRRDGRGLGLAFARYKNQKCYAAVAIELTVDRGGAVSLRRAVIAADAGLIVNPDLVRAQLEGGLVQAASWTLKEEVTFDAAGITSLDWESYPILTLREAPEIDVVLADRSDEPSLGCGEASAGPTAAAIANAIFDATGARVRQIPFVPERVRAAMREEADPDG